MISSGEVKAPNTYKVGPYTFIDEDGDGKLSPADLVEVPAAKGTKGEAPQQIRGDKFADMMPSASLGTDYGTLKKQAKRFLQDAKYIAELMKIPKDDDELANRFGVEHFIIPQILTIIMDDAITEEQFKVHLSYSYEVPREDIGARHYLSAKGYRFIQAAGDPYMLLAIKDPDKWVRAAKPYASDNEVRECLRRIRFVR